VLAPPLVVRHEAQCAGKTDAVASQRGTPRAFEDGMFGLIRRFVVGWLLVRLVRRITRGGNATRAR
jgi:hypothetical protein